MASQQPEPAQTNLEAASAAPRKRAFIPRQSYWNRYIGDLYLSGSFSQEFNFGSQVGSKWVLDYMVNEQVSIGAQTGLYQTREDNARYLSNYLGIRVSYHLLRAKLHRGQNHWNVYTGISGEAEIGGGQKDWHEKRLLLDLHLGARYRLSAKWYIWAEAAMNNASLGLSLAL